LGDDGEERPVVVGDRGPADLSARDSELVSQNDHLEILRPARSDSKTCQNRNDR